MIFPTYSIGDLIKEARTNKGMTLRELEKASGVSYSFIGAVERGRYNPSRENIVSIANALGIDSDSLLINAGYMPINDIRERARMDSEELDILLEKIVRPSQMVRIPILGVIKAGYDLYAEQHIIGYDLIAEDAVKNGDYFYLVVNGDSMVDEGIKEGYRVLVKHQSFVENGKIGVVIVNGDEGTLKRVYYQDDYIVLVAANKDITPRFYKQGEVLIQGQVVKVEFDV